MSKAPARALIRLKGVRHNNLKNFDLDLPLHRLIVVTGLSGSGKSSLAFDTLFAEGQRRYIETFSPYARQFFDRMDKPQVESIEGIPPAIAIEQRNAVRTTRSTVGTMTEICDYLKVLWPHLARLHCRSCGQVVRKEPPQQIWETLKFQHGQGSGENLITFDLPLTEKLPLDQSLALVAKQGYQRLLLDRKVVRLDEALAQVAAGKRLVTEPVLTVVQDRVKPGRANRARFVEAAEQAYHFGKGKLTLWEIQQDAFVGGVGTARPHSVVVNYVGTSRPHPEGAGLTQPDTTVRNPQFFSNRSHCAACDIEYGEPSPAMFSFNHPLGACPACKGFGRIISIDYRLAIPDRSRTLAQGVVKPWQTGMSAECQDDLMRMCRQLEIPTNVPFEQLPQKWQDLVIEGEPDYGKDEEHEWPRAWYGVKGYFRWLESKAYKMHVRVLLSRYRAYTPCPACHGDRFKPDTLLYRVALPGEGTARTSTLSDFYRLPIRDALPFIEGLAAMRRVTASDPVGVALGEVRARLGYLNQVGLGYLTLDRPTRSLSGGETERVNLTACLGTRLVNTLYVLDEPSVGLHPRDTDRLVSVLRQLRDAGNTVVVVEHEASVMRAADQIVDLGPGHGATGGQVVFQGSFAEIQTAQHSLTGEYLSGRKQVEVPRRRPVGRSQTRGVAPATDRPKRIAEERSGLALNDLSLPYGKDTQNAPRLELSGATRHNLRNLSVEIPLERFVCVTGVSGSGKTTLVREVLLPALTGRFRGGQVVGKAFDRLSDEEDQGDLETEEAASGARLAGWEDITEVVLVDQASLGKTPRSNPAVYIRAFDDIREVFARSEPARQRGLKAGAFSFNSRMGQCERCRGAGFEKIEMQFLSDVFIRCPDCDGRRYRQNILEVKIRPGGVGTASAAGSHRAWAIADLLDATVDEVIHFLRKFPESQPAASAVRRLALLQEVGLGYLRLGQPINTLSGGESQRLKLVRHLADSDAALDATLPAAGRPSTLFLFDEPTTGLHFDDVRQLLAVFQRLVDAGHSVLVIEHNLDVIKCADWVIDLGPGAGDEGGELVAAGTPEDVAASPRSHTGAALRGVLFPQRSWRKLSAAFRKPAANKPGARPR